MTGRHSSKRWSVSLQLGLVCKSRRERHIDSSRPIYKKNEITERIQAKGYRDVGDQKRLKEKG